MSIVKSNSKKAEGESNSLKNTSEDLNGQFQINED